MANLDLNTTDNCPFAHDKYHAKRHHQLVNLVKKINAVKWTLVSIVLISVVMNTIVTLVNRRALEAHVLYNQKRDDFPDNRRNAEAYVIKSGIPICIFHSWGWVVFTIGAALVESSVMMRVFVGTEVLYVIGNYVGVGIYIFELGLGPVSSILLHASVIILQVRNFMLLDARDILIEGEPIDIRDKNVNDVIKPLGE